MASEVIYQKDCLSSGSFHSDPKSFYKQQYFEALDIITVSIEDRFKDTESIAISNRF